MGLSVATPSGVLTGVAGFSWDGAAWQPAGRAASSVGIAGGVLDGVALCNFDGTAWQPAGRTMPDVATPTGVLDGVAVYTWSGSAWTPASGRTGAGTPSGTLRGVAAFSWDGTNWQPAGQARASVPTPYGVLDGVAVYNWTGSAWGPSAGLASLDMSFLGGPLDPRVTFTRASTGTYFDVNGTLQTAASDVPRFDYDPITHAPLGLLIEEARTNILLNSATLGTQSVAVTAQAYTLSFYGTGTITKSGTASGALVGSGAFPARVSQTFTPTAGTLTLTVSGSVLNAQLEAGAFPTSYIATVAASVTRSADVATAATSAWYSQSAGSFVGDFSMAQVPASGTQAGVFRADDGSNNNLAEVMFGPGANAASGFGQANNVNQLNVGTANSVTLGAISKVAITYGPAWGLMLNGGALTNAASGTTAPTGINRVVLGGANPTLGAWMLNGYMRRFRYWPRVLSNAEMQQVTT